MPPSLSEPKRGFWRISEYAWKPPESVMIPSGHAVQPAQRGDRRAAGLLHQVKHVHHQRAHPGGAQVAGVDRAHHADGRVGQERRQRQLAMRQKQACRLGHRLLLP
jgi:hypothetical protein